MTSKPQDEILAEVRGKAISSASSSLDTFAIAFDDGSGLAFHAASSDNGRGTIALESMPASGLPVLSEAVCSVDWSWIVESRLLSFKCGDSTISLALDKAGTLTVGCSFWQGKPFLSFQPYKPART